MNQIQLYLNNQLTDLSDDSPIALTFQINDLAEVKNQQGNTSNQFKIPLTQRNRQILGFPDDIAFCTDAPYRQYEARIIQDGLEIIPYGVAELNSVDDNTANITVLSGNVDFFDAIDGKLYDMGDSSTPHGASQPFKLYEHRWTLQNVVNSQQKSDGWIWPVVDYGKIPEDTTTQPVTIDVRYLRPGFFLKTALQTIVNAAGYKINPKSTLLQDPLYNKLIVQFANDSFEHSADYQYSQDNFSSCARKTNGQSIDGKNNQGIITFSDTKNTDPSFSFQGNAYVAKENLTINVALTYGLEVTRTTSTGSLPYISINIIKHSNGVSTVIEQAQHNSTSKKGEKKVYNKQTLNADIALQTGDSITIEYSCWPGYERVKGNFYTDARVTFTSKRTEVAFGQNIQCERIFPDISQKDLLKDTLQRFGIICQTDNTNKTITFASFRDIVNNIPIAKDWTSKCLDQGKSINFKLGNYAQINYLKYKQDDNVTPQNFADSQINVDDKTLATSADLFESQFAPTLNRSFLGNTIAQIKKLDITLDPNATEFSTSTQPRILIYDTFELLSSGKSVRFTDGLNSIDVNDKIAIPYFYKLDGEDDLRYDKLRTRYYPELEKILKRCKKIVRYFLLTPRDILELDLLMPIYLQQDSAYFYINKIDSWRKGQPTKVELVSLG